jgi:hypothetical protein
VVDKQDPLPILQILRDGPVQALAPNKHRDAAPVIESPTPIEVYLQSSHGSTFCTLTLPARVGPTTKTAAVCATGSGGSSSARAHITLARRDQRRCEHGRLGWAGPEAPDTAVCRH